MPEPSLLDLASLTEQLGPHYARLPEAVRARHLELLHALDGPADATLDVRMLANGHVEVTVCAGDQPGALSVLAGLFTAHALDIRSADVFTVALPSAPAVTGATSYVPYTPPRAAGVPRSARPPRWPARTSRPAPARPSRALLDSFEVQLPVGEPPPNWHALEGELRGLTALLAAGDLDAATEQVLEGIERQTRRAEPRGANEPLYPVEIRIEPQSEATRLFIQAMDTPGFLFEFTAALTALRANVVRAEVRTIDGETSDTFWLTGEGGRAISVPARLEELRVAAALVKQFMHLLPGSPQPAQALQQFGALVRSLSQQPGVAGLKDIASPDVLQRLADLMGVSRFLWEDFLRMQRENLLPVLADSQALARRISREALVEMMRDAVTAQPGDAPGDAAKRLNIAKDREMFRIDLRHITRQIGLLAFARELADLAEATVTGAAELATARLQAVHGAPRLEGSADGAAGAAGAPCGWAICALGKAGGRELGYASDIELLFVYEGAGLTDGARPISNHDYFEAFVRTVRDSISVRQEGIFELDLRLRPYGAKGALATSLVGFEQYYSIGGAAEQFERLALVRLRCFAGTPEVMARVQALRDAWVYSGAPIDAANILALRGRQATELVRPGEVNAKYSPGGVVDLEYFVQALQIEAGARDPAVRAPGTLEGAELLARAGYLPPMMAARLQEAYGFMRGLIDALRVVRGNAKDLAIPPADSRAFAYLQRRMSYDSAADLARAIEVRMAFGRSLWDRFEELRAAVPPAEARR